MSLLCLPSQLVLLTNSQGAKLCRLAGLCSAGRTNYMEGGPLLFLPFFKLCEIVDSNTN